MWIEWYNGSVWATVPGTYSVAKMSFSNVRLTTSQIAQLNLKEHHDSVPAEMPAGSVLVWHGSLWHGGGANTTDERRVGIADNYCGGMIRQQENQQLGVPREIAATFDKRLQRLCGYGTYNGLIGHIDKHDPLTLLDPDDEHAMLWDGA